MNRSNQVKKIVTVCSTLMSASAVWAADNVWTNGTGSGNVMQPGNWSLGHAPVNTERAVIASGAQMVINVSQGIVADQIDCSIPLYVNGGYLACRALNTTSTLSTYNSASILLIESMTVNSTWNTFSTSIYASFNTSPTVYIQPGASVVLGNGGVSFGVRVENRGSIDGQNQTIGLGALNTPVFFTNRTEGELRNVNFDTPDTPNFGSTYLINEGYIGYIGGAPRFDAYFANSGALELDAADLTVTQMVDLAQGHLDNGAWTLRNGSHISHNYGDIDRIGPNVTVRMDGGQNYFQGLSRISSIQGRLELKNTTFQIAPPFFGNCRLGDYGFLRMEQGARMEVLGGFSIAPDSVLDKLVTAPNENDVIATYVSSDVGGQLIVEFQDENLIPAGTRIPLMKDIDNCCAIGGQFVSTLVFGLTGTTSTDYGQHQVSLLVGNACPTDLDHDGVVGLSDLAILLAHFGSNTSEQASGNVDGDADVDLSDLSILLSTFGTTCS